MSRPNRPAAAGPAVAPVKSQPATVSYAQLAKQAKAANAKAPTPVASVNEKSNNATNVKPAELQTNNASSSKALDDVQKPEIAAVKLPAPERPIADIKVSFGTVDFPNLPPAPFIPLPVRFYDLKSISFGTIEAPESSIENFALPKDVKFVVKYIPLSQRKTGDKNVKGFTPSHFKKPSQPGGFDPNLVANSHNGSNPQHKHGHSSSQDINAHSSPIPGYHPPGPSASPHPHQGGYPKPPFVPQPNPSYGPGHYSQFPQHGGPQPQWMPKPNYPPGPPQANSPNPQASFNSPHSRGKDKSGPQQSPGGFQPGSSPNPAGPNMPGPGWNPSFFPNYNGQFDPSYPQFNGYAPPPFTGMPPIPGMMPNTSPSNLNTNASVFVPSFKPPSKAIKIVNPKTKAIVDIPEIATVTKEATPPVVVRISKPVGKGDVPGVTPEVSISQPEKPEVTSKEVALPKVAEDIKSIKEDKADSEVKEAKPTEDKSPISDLKSSEKVSNQESEKKDFENKEQNTVEQPQEPIVEKPSTEKVNEVKPKVEEEAELKSKVEQAVVEKFKVEESVVEKPKTEEAASDKPKSVEATSDKPESDELTIEEPKAEELSQPKGVEEDLSVFVAENDKPQDKDLVDEPTILSVNTETVLLTKAKPKRAVRTKPVAAEVVPSEEPKIEEQVKATDTIPEATAEAPNNDLSSQKPAQANETPSRSGAAPPGFGPPGFESKGPIRSNTISGPNGKDFDGKARPVPSRLGSMTANSSSYFNNGPLNASPRNTEFFEALNYPPNINRPNLPDGKFRYERNFLLQFKDMCTDKPDEMKNLDVISSEENSGRQDSNDRNRGNHRRANTSGRIGGIKDNFGDFAKPRTSEDRFKLSNMQMRNENRGPLGGRTSSGGPLPPMNHHMGNQGRDSRGGRGGRGGRGNKQGHGHHSQGGPTIPLDQVVPLEASENRWTPKKNDDDKVSVVTRKIKALLNKLTLEKFDSISQQILDIANESVQETDGLTLRTVIQLIFEKATDEPNFSALYAKLCFKMQTQLNEEIYDENVFSKSGLPTKGGALFRKYILTRCQKEFEKGWKIEGMEKIQEEADMLSDEYYKLAKAKRQGLGLIRFIGEVFKLSMLTEGIMHYCVKRLLDNDPDEDEIESLSKLITTIGKQLDTPNNKQHMSAYFEQISALSKDTKLSSRIRFMLLDVIDLRKSKWFNAKNDVPKTLQQIKDDAERESEEKQKQDKMRRSGSSGGRGLPPFNHGGNRPQFDKERQRGGDGWNTVGNNPAPVSRKTGDLSSFGNISRSKTTSNSLSLGPSSNSVFNSLGGAKPASREPNTQVKKPASMSGNIFSMLADSEPKSATRPPLILQKKSTPVQPEEEVEAELQTIAPDALERKVKTIVDEYIVNSDFKESTMSLEELSPFKCNDEIIFKMMSHSIEKKAQEVEKVSQLLGEIKSADIISSADFLAGSAKMMAILDDLSIDVPAAFTYMAQFLAPYAITLGQLIDLSEPLTELSNPLPPGPKLFISYVQKRKDAGEDEEVLLKQFKDDACDLTKIYHPEDQTLANLVKLSESSSVAFLAPVIKESSWWTELASKST